jgi:hypothetical protein
MREVLFLIGRGDVVLYGDASDSPVALPDSRRRWEEIWRRRKVLREIAHSHPIGPLAFSREDETTMEALASALGRGPLFSVVAPDGMIRREQNGDRLVQPEPWWAALLRLASGMTEAPRDAAPPRRP